MVLVRYRLQNGTDREIDASRGTSVMQAAIRNNVPGIEAECGGSLDCATCHVYVDSEFLDRLPPPSAVELALLEGVAAERRPNSRLGCQLVVQEEHAGLAVTVPERQL